MPSLTCTDKRKNSLLGCLHFLTLSTHRTGSYRGYQRLPCCYTDSPSQQLLLLACFWMFPPSLRGHCRSGLLTSDCLSVSSVGDSTNSLGLDSPRTKLLSVAPPSPCRFDPPVLLFLPLFQPSQMLVTHTFQGADPMLHMHLHCHTPLRLSRVSPSKPFAESLPSLTPQRTEWHRSASKLPKTTQDSDFPGTAVTL